jgi:YHS domain-containing protein
MQTQNTKTKTFFGAILAAAIFLPMADGCHGCNGHSQAFAADKNTEKVKPYPLDKCVVSDEKLDSMGKPYVFTNNNQEVKLCCKNCLKDFKKEPAKYTKKIEDALKGKSGK